jgi:hypothetical protein
MARKRGQRDSTDSQRRQTTQPPHSTHTGEQREIWDQEETFFEDEFDEEEAVEEEEEDRPSSKRRSSRRRRKDAGSPRMKPRDIKAFRWIGEQGAARRDDLQELLGRMPEGKTNEPGRLSASRMRHIIEERWEPAGMVYYKNLLGKQWVWPSKRGLSAAGLSWSPHRPADINLEHIHQINRVRLHLENHYWSRKLKGEWESERWYVRRKKEWAVLKKAEPSTYIPDVYQMNHTPDGLWRFRNTGDNTDYLAIIEIEISAKHKDQLWQIMNELSIYAPVVWYYVDMNPEEGVYDGLMEVLAEMDTRDRERFVFYDLADPRKLVYHFKPE